MILFCFFLSGVIGGFWGLIVCWFEFDGKFLVNIGFVIVVIEGEGLGLVIFFIFLVVFFEFFIVVKCLLIEVSRNVGFYIRI